MIFKDSFDYYSIIIKFLEKTLGDIAEITLYSFEEKEEGELISKSFNCDFELGTPIPKTIEKLLEKYNKDENENLNFITNFPGKNLNGQLFRVSTFFIKDNQNILKGVFSIKINISSMIGAANFINDLLKNITGGEERNIAEESEEVEKMSTIEEYAQYTIKQFFNNLKKPVDALNTAEKIEIVKKLDKKGIFNLKGSISELAKKFNTSEKTIYRYLTTIK